jgi:hypothetical protein
VIVVDRVDAGAVAVTGFFQTFESPQIFSPIEKLGAR